LKTSNRNMKICGVELKGNDAIFAIVDVRDGEILFSDCPARKIKFGESVEQASARNFYGAICGFIRDQRIDAVAIKQRATKGPFAGGPVTFQMEASFQLNPDAAAFLFSGAAIAAAHRRHNFPVPSQLSQYQVEAYLTACCAAKALGK